MRRMLAACLGSTMIPVGKLQRSSCDVFDNGDLMDVMVAAF